MLHFSPKDVFTLLLSSKHTHTNTFLNVSYTYIYMYTFLVQFFYNLVFRSLFYSSTHLTISFPLGFQPYLSFQTGQTPISTFRFHSHRCTKRKHTTSQCEESLRRTKHTQTDTHQEREKKHVRVMSF